MIKNVLEHFRSIRTSLVLFLALIILSMVSTIPASWYEQAPNWLRTTAQILGVDATFRSPLFLGLLAALALNIMFCTLHRVPPRLRVGTGYLFPDLPATTFTDPLSGTEFPLGFGVELRERREEYYPLRLRLGLRESATGQRIRQFDIVEGDAGGAIDADAPIAVRVLSTDGKTVLLAVGTAGATRTVELSLSPGTGASATEMDKPSPQLSRAHPLPVWGKRPLSTPAPARNNRRRPPSGNRRRR